jgi:hypothetical protein
MRVSGEESFLVLLCNLWEERLRIESHDKRVVPCA